jgi:hypothetical protein
MQEIHLFAYLDPGSSALIWQMLLSIAVGVWFVFKSVREVLSRGMTWIASLFRSSDRASHSPIEKN